jgi:hypothetical protein
MQGWNWVGGAVGALGEVVVVRYGFSASFGIATVLYTLAVIAILSSLPNFSLFRIFQNKVSKSKTL